MTYIIKQEGLYQNKVNPNLVFTCNCKMGYYLYLVRSKHLQYHSSTWAEYTQVMQNNIL